MDDEKRQELWQQLEQASLPVSSLNAALPHLRRPFAGEAVKWKVQSTWPKGPDKQGAVLVAYMDARLVIERFNAVVGSEWTAKYLPTSKADIMMCELTVFGVPRIDVGEATNKGLSKDLISDALKRAAVHFGVGVSVYALPLVRWNLADAGAHLRKIGRDDKTSLALTDQGHAALRAGYMSWLESKGKDFGPVLDHGDAIDSGMDVVPEGAPEEPVETPPAVPEPLTDDTATQLRADIEAAYVELRKLSKQRLLPAVFQAEMTAAQGSHEQLREMLVRIQDLTADEQGKLERAGAAA
jgi:hypothetical protein